MFFGTQIVLIGKTDVMKKLILSFFVLGSVSAIGQLAEINVNGNIGFPQSEFKNNYEDQLYGFGVNAMFNTRPNAVFEYGFGVNYSQMNSIDGDVPVYVNDLQTRASLEVKSKEINTELKGRLIPYHGVVQPFIEFNAGANTYYTNSDIKTDIAFYNEDEQLVTKTVSTGKEGIVDGMNFYVGWTGGAKIVLTRNLLLSASVGRSYTTQSRYLDNSTIEISEKGNVSYGLSESSTSQIRTSLGLVIRF